MYQAVADHTNTNSDFKADSYFLCYTKEDAINRGKEHIEGLKKLGLVHKDEKIEVSAHFLEIDDIYRGVLWCE